MSARDRSRSHARLQEEAAVRLIRRWVGDRGKVIDRGNTNLPDFEIRYHDGRTGWGDVGWHENRHVQEAPGPHRATGASRGHPAGRSFGKLARLPQAERPAPRGPQQHQRSRAGRYRRRPHRNRPSSPTVWRKRCQDRPTSRHRQGRPHQRDRGSSARRARSGSRLRSQRPREPCRLDRSGHARHARPAGQVARPPSQRAPRLHLHRQRHGLRAATASWSIPFGAFQTDGQPCRKASPTCGLCRPGGTAISWRGPKSPDGARRRRAIPNAATDPARPTHSVASRACRANRRPGAHVVRLWSICGLWSQFCPLGIERSTLAAL